MKTTPSPLDPPLTPALTRSDHRHLRNAAVCLRFTELYERQRLRFDDVIAQLAAEFFLSPRTITRILKSPHTAPAPSASPQ